MSPSQPGNTVVSLTTHDKWADAVTAVIQDGHAQLDFTHVEHWIQHELYARAKNEPDARFQPLPSEVPYLFGEKRGWVDMALTDSTRHAWDWVELKVGWGKWIGFDYGQANISRVVDSFVKDTRKLASFDRDSTVADWRSGGSSTWENWLLP